MGLSTVEDGFARKHSDTPPRISCFGNKNRLDGSMAIRKLAQGGRPSKGKRHTFLVKPDLERAEKLQDILELLHTNGVDYLTPIIAAHIDSVDLDALRNQEALPIATAG
ncbi:hypothetical protein ACX801_18105 [Arthrobacter bambusae]